MKAPKKEVVTRALEYEEGKEKDDDDDDDDVNCEPGSDEEKRNGHHSLERCCALSSLPTFSLDDIIKRVRESEYVCSLFFIILVATFIFAVLLLAHSSELNDVFLVLFSVCALLLVLLGALFRVRNNEVQDSRPCFEVFARDDNGVRAFMILEAIVDIVLGALSLSNETLVGVSSVAIVLAVMATAVLVVVPWRFRHRERVLNYHLPLAVVLTDSSDVLLLLRVIFLRAIEAKDVLLFVFLVLNVAVSELSTLIAIRAEQKTPPPANEKPDDRKTRLEKAIRMRTDMRNKALAQTVITGTLVIPAVLTVVLSEFLDSPSGEVVLILLPLVSFLFRASETEALCGRWLFKTRLNDSWRDLLPRIYVLTCALVLGAYDGALSLEYELQQIVFFAYAIYIGVPFLVRVFEDSQQHQVNIITTRPLGFADRETDKHRSKLRRSALADHIDRTEKIYPVEEDRGTGKLDPSVAFACYCRYDAQKHEDRRGDFGSMKACLHIKNEDAGDLEEQNGLAVAIPATADGERVHISCLNWSSFAIGDAGIIEVLRLVALHLVSELL